MAQPPTPKLTKDWNNEAYVSLHLVQTMLEMAGLPRKTSYSHWIPEYKIKVPKLTNDQLKETEKEVDFLVQDYGRYVNFLVEVKTANTRIDDNARFQLETYLRHSRTRFGVLIDPFLVKIYEYKEGQCSLKCEHNIENPEKVEPVAHFLKTFLDQVKMRTIAIHASKGGVGKTTLVVNISYELAKQGNRVLVIDLDDQANTSLLLGVNKADELDQASDLDKFDEILKSFNKRKELVEFLADYELPNFNYKDYIQSSLLNQILNKTPKSGRIDVIPSSYKTKDSKIAELGILLEKKLDKALQRPGISDDYDYAVIDTPPSASLIARNGLCAAQYIIIPSQMEYLSMYGIISPIKAAKQVQDDNPRRGFILGIVPMMTEAVNLHSKIKQLIKKKFPTITILQEIKRTVSISQAAQARQPLSLFAEKGKVASAGAAATQFSKLTQEIVNQIKKVENSIGMQK
jgi:chromosome partitioning protein